MGAEFTYQTKYHERARKQFDASTLKECNYVKGAKVVWNPVGARQKWLHIIRGE